MKSAMISLVLFAAAACMGGGRAWALGTEEFGNKKLSPANYDSWPGLAEVVNDRHRVYQNWVNGNENCYYQGDTQALNAALRKFAKSDLETHQVVLLPGPNEVGGFQGKKPIPFDWRLHMMGGIAAAVFDRHKDGAQVFDTHPTMYVSVGKNIDLKKLTVPKGVTLLGVEDLRKRFVEGIKKGGMYSKGYGAMYLAQIDTHHKESAKSIASLLKDKDRWLTAMALGSLGKFGANAADVVPMLENYEAKDKNNTKKLKEVIETIKAAKDRSEQDRRKQRELQKITEFLESRK